MREGERQEGPTFVLIAAAHFPGSHLPACPAIQTLTPCIQGYSRLAPPLAVLAPPTILARRIIQPSRTEGDVALLDRPRYMQRPYVRPTARHQAQRRPPVAVSLLSSCRAWRHCWRASSFGASPLACQACLPSTNGPPGARLIVRLRENPVTCSSRPQRAASSKASTQNSRHTLRRLAAQRLLF